jgi:tetratricopeptide (TPR) repeat protein
VSQTAPIIELPDIIQSLQNKQWTGTLEVLTDARSTRLFFRNGMIQHCAPDRNTMPLGKVLNKLGLIDQADYVMTMVDYEQTGRACGEVLVELGLVDSAGIMKALSFQAREHVLDVFNWKHVDVRFDVGEGQLDSEFSPQQREISLNMAGMSVLMEVARRDDEWSIVRETIPSERDVVASTRDEGLAAGLIDRRVVSLIDGYRSAQEIADDAPLQTIEVLKSLAGLVKDGHLKCLTPPELAQVGVVAEGDDDPEKAIRMFELAVERGLDHIDLHKKIANTYATLGRRKEALARWVALAERCTTAGRLDLTIEAYEHAVELDPEDLALGQVLVGLLIQSQNTASASNRLKAMIDVAQREGANLPLAKVIELMEQYLELVPTDRGILERLAQVHLEDDDNLSAMVRLDEKAAVLNAEGVLDEAVEVYYRILKIDPENLEARLLLAQNLGTMGSTDDAVREYRRLADILFKSGVIGNSINWPFLIKVYESIVELEPSSTPAWEWLAKAYIENGKQDLAISRFLGMADSLATPAGETPPHEIIQPLRSVVELAPQRLDVRSRLVRAHLALNQIERGVRALRGLAEEALRQEQVGDAISAYTEALEHQPFDMDSRRGLAAIHETKNEYDEAFEAWKAVGGLCHRAGLLDEAIKDFHRAFQLRDSDEHMVREMAEVEARRSKTRNSAMLFARYAMLQMGKGNPGAAREALERANRLEPNLPQVTQLMSKLAAESP